MVSDRMKVFALAAGVGVVTAVTVDVMGIEDNARVATILVGGAIAGYIGNRYKNCCSYAALGGTLGFIAAALAYKVAITDKEDIKTLAPQQPSQALQLTR